jgi:hypothetical protein
MTIGEGSQTNRFRGAQYPRRGTEEMTIGEGSRGPLATSRFIQNDPPFKMTLGEGSSRGLFKMTLGEGSTALRRGVSRRYDRR